MANFSVSVDLDTLLDANKRIVETILPRVSQAVREVAEHGVTLWQDEVYKARLWSVEKNRYVDSIDLKQTGEYSYLITTDFPLAGDIERGRPARDLKKMLGTSIRTRMVHTGQHAGQKYLIIPLRHNAATPSGEGAHARQMPPDIYRMAKRLSATTFTRGVGLRITATGHLVPYRKYQWGDRLKTGDKRSIYEGMYRFNTSVGKSRASAYITFRTMGQWASGWIVLPTEGLHLIQKVSEMLQAELEKKVFDAITGG